MKSQFCLFQFFIDGYESAAQQLSLVFYYLACNAEVQEKAYEETKALAEKIAGDGGDITTTNLPVTGEDVNDLKYIDAVISETFRIAPLCVTFRTCTKDWVIPGGNGAKITKGMRVCLSIVGTHVRFLCV